jgi:hypothetical protein
VIVYIGLTDVQKILVPLPLLANVNPRKPPSNLLEIYWFYFPFGIRIGVADGQLGLCSILKPLRSTKYRKLREEK